jgi:hypothetical protein
MGEGRRFVVDYLSINSIIVLLSIRSAWL